MKPCHCGDAPAGLRRRAVPVLPGEQPAAQRRPGEHAHAQRLGGRHDLALHPALQQRVLDLGADQRRAARPGALPGRGLRGLPAGEVADPDVPGPAGGDGEVAGGQRLLERRRLVPGVQLPEVDVVQPEPLQGGVEGGQQVPAGGAAAHRPGAGPAHGLGRDQDVGPGDDVGEQVPEGPLALAVAVDVGGVDQRAAGVDEGRQLHGRLVLVGVAAPRHGAQCQPGHDQPASSQRPLLHDRPTYRRRPTVTGQPPTLRGGAAGRARFGPYCVALVPPSRRARRRPPSAREALT